MKKIISLLLALVLQGGTMSTTTTNYALVKPDTTDYYDINVNNSNMDIIDAQLKLNANVTNVKEYGAIGDGVTNDTAAIQSAINSISGRGILFFPIGDYKASIEVPARISILGQGGGSRIIPLANGWGIKMVGTHTGTALPSTRTDQVINLETYPYIKDIRIQGDGSTTNGIQIDKLMQPIISGVEIEECGDGIQIVNRCRNVIIDSCHILNNYGPGIHVTAGTDIHQFTISNSIINYCKRAIHLDNCDLRNVLITGCDLEYSDNGADVSNVEIDVSTSGIVRFVTITGCQMEGSTANGQMINLKGNSADRKNINTVVISGNYINNFETNGIGIKGNYCNGVQITGNDITTDGRAIWFEYSSKVNVTGDTGGSYSQSSGIAFGMGNEYITISGVQLCDITDGVTGALSIGGSNYVTINNCMVINPPAVGIFLNTPTNVVVSNCIVMDNRTTKQMTYPIYEATSSDKNMIINNRVNAGVTGGITKSGANTVVTGNLEMD